MKTYIIHLERAIKRRSHIASLISKHNLDCEVIKAFDYVNVKDEEYVDFCDIKKMQEFPQWLTRGMVCACYTHYLTYQKIIADGVDAAFIIEDDVILPDNIGDLLDKIEENASDNEVIMLHYMGFEPIYLEQRSAIKLMEGVDLMTAKSLMGVTSAAGYVITRAAAITMSQCVLPVRFGTDSWSEFIREGGVQNVRFIHPMPVKTAGFKSTVAVIGQSALRSGITRIIDDYRIPPFFQFLRAMRHRAIAKHTKIVIDKSILKDG
ncbi:MAG TPA: glycosyltransferase family 25 protein [Pyrinomonadaceae bacterium]|nr:glycosyltransferase family 25 protein [Pyrinomonadaceae bacterium]